MQLSNEDNFSEFANNPLTPPMVRGVTDEVKQELQKAIRCRRVAQGLDEIPNYDTQRPSSNQVRKKRKKNTLIKIIFFRRVCYFSCSNSGENFVTKLVFFFQLSQAELEKRRLRRERNKLAAFKCRQRRKEHMQELEEVSIFTLIPIKVIINCLIFEK